MKINRLFFLLLSGTLVFSAQPQTITVKNTSAYDIKDYVVEIPVKNLKLSIGSYEVVFENGIVVPLEIVAGLKGCETAIFPVEKLEANSTQTVEIRKGTAAQYPKRTYAELAHKIGGPFNGNS